MIKLIKEIGGQKVELDVISLNGKATVRSSNYKELKKKGITAKQLSEAGFEIEKELKEITKQ